MGMAAEIPNGAGDTDVGDENADSGLVNADSGETTESNEVFDQARSYVNGSDTDDEDGSAEANEDEDSKPQVKSKQPLNKDKAKAKAAEAKQAQSRYEQRVRSLIDRSKKAEAYAQQVQQQYQQHYAQQQQVQREAEQRYAQLEKQHAVAAREMELIRQREEAAQEAQLDPLEKAMRIERKKAMSEVEQRLRQEYDQRFQQMSQRQQQLVEHLQKQQQEAEIQSRIQGYDQQTDHAIRELMNGLSPDLVKELAPLTKTMALNLAAATNRLPQDAAKAVDKWAHRYVLAKMKLKAVAGAATSAKGAKVPPGLPAGKKPTKGNGRITQQQARANGFSSALEAQIASNPPPWAS